MQVFGKLGHHFTRFQAATIFRKAFNELGKGIEQIDIMVHHLMHARTQYLDGHITAIVQSCKMHLRYGSGSDRLRVEFAVGLANSHAEATFNFSHRQGRIERRYPILQLGQFVSKVWRQQVAAGREHLAELNEDRP